MSSLDFLLWLDQIRSPILNDVMIGLSALGSEEAYTIILTTIYLCIGHRFGFHLFVMFLGGAYANGVLKEAFGTLRPFEMYSEQLNPLYPGSAAGDAFPSGHAQNAATVWGIIAIRQKSPLWRRLILLLILGIGFSRLYCSVHWPADILGGFGFGGLLVAIYLFVMGAWQTTGRRLEMLNAAIIVVAASVLMFMAAGEIEVCADSAGAILGAGLGYILLEARGGYNAKAPRLTQVLKIVIALAVLLGMRAGLQDLLGESPGADYARYALIGFTCAYLLPAFFTGYYNWRMRAKKAMEMLAEEEEEEAEQDG